MELRVMAPSPQPRVKRVDFQSGVLTFDLPQEVCAGSGGSGSDGSPRSSEGSPEGAASTLLAPPQREHDQEEGSRTLVLVSAGNGNASPGNGLVSPLDGQGTLAALTPQGERPAPDESEPGTFSSIIRSEPRPIVAMTTATIISGGTSSPPFTKVERTFVHIAETTHLNIMTTRHQLPGLEEEPSVKHEQSDVPREEEGEDREERVAEAREEQEEEEEEEEEKESSSDEVGMKKEEGEDEQEKESSESEGENEVEVDESDREKESRSNGETSVREEEIEAADDVVKIVDVSKNEAEEKERRRGETSSSEEPEMKVESAVQFVSSERSPGEVQSHYDVEARPNVRAKGVQSLQALERGGEEHLPNEQEPEDQRAVLPPQEEEGLDDSRPRPHRRSRIPVLVSEEETGSDQSSQTSQDQARQARRGRHHHLALLLLERKQPRPLRPHRNSSSSQTTSEEDIHQSDDSTRQRGKVSRPDGQVRSRIPRPITSLKKPSIQSGNITIPRAQRSISSTLYRLQRPTSGRSTVPQQLKPQPSLSKARHAPPIPAAKPTHSAGRTALPGVSHAPASPTVRSLSTSPRSYSTSRTDSPSPQRRPQQTSAGEWQRLPNVPRPSPSQPIKPRAQDSTPKRSRTYPSTISQRGKNNSLKGKSNR